MNLKIKIKGFFEVSSLFCFFLFFFIVHVWLWYGTRVWYGMFIHLKKVKKKKNEWPFLEQRECFWVVAAGCIVPVCMYCTLWVSGCWEGCDGEWGGIFGVGMYYTRVVYLHMVCGMYWYLCSRLSYRASPCGQVVLVAGETLYDNMVSYPA